MYDVVERGSLIGRKEVVDFVSFTNSSLLHTCRQTPVHHHCCLTMDGLAADAGTLAIPFALLISDVPYLEMLARQLQEAHGTMSSFRYQVSR